jgi:hypothetical protein
LRLARACGSRSYGARARRRLGCLSGGRIFFTRSDGQGVGVFVIFVIVVVVFVIFVVGFGFFGEVDDGSGLGEVEAVGGGLDGEDDVGGVGLGVDALSIVAGQLEAVEDGGGALGLELAGGEGVDYCGDGELDGFAILERVQLDVLATMLAVEVVVEVAVDAVVEGWGLALASVGLDVAAKWKLHRSPHWWGYPPGVFWLEVEWLQ